MGERDIQNHVPQIGHSNSQCPNLFLSTFFHPPCDQSVHHSGPLHPRCDPLYWSLTTLASGLSNENLGDEFRAFADDQIHANGSTLGQRIIDHEDSPGGTSSPFDQGNEDELRKLNLASQGQSSRVSPQQLEYVPGAHPFEPGLDRKAEAPDFGKFQWIPEMGVAQSSEDRMMDSKEWSCPHDGCNKRYRRRQEAVRHMRDKHETPHQCFICGTKWTRPEKIRDHLISKHWDNFTEEERQEIRHLHGLISTIDVLERLRIAMLPRSYKP